MARSKRTSTGTRSTSSACRRSRSHNKSCRPSVCRQTGSTRSRRTRSRGGTRSGPARRRDSMASPRSPAKALLWRVPPRPSGMSRSTRRRAACAPTTAPSSSSTCTRTRRARTPTAPSSSASWRSSRPSQHGWARRGRRASRWCSAATLTSRRGAWMCRGASACCPWPSSSTRLKLARPAVMQPPSRRSAARSAPRGCASWPPTSRPGHASRCTSSRRRCSAEARSRSATKTSRRPTPPPTPPTPPLPTPPLPLPTPPTTTKALLPSLLVLPRAVGQAMVGQAMVGRHRPRSSAGTVHPGCGWRRCSSSFALTSASPTPTRVNSPG